MLWQKITKKSKPAAYVAVLVLFEDNSWCEAYVTYDGTWAYASPVNEPIEPTHFAYVDVSNKE